MILHAYVDVYVLCVCIVGHGGDYTILTAVDWLIDFNCMSTCLELLYA